MKSGGVGFNCAVSANSVEPALLNESAVPRGAGVVAEGGVFSCH